MNGLRLFRFFRHQAGQQASIIEEIPAKDFGYAEYEMPVWYGLEDFLTKPPAEFHHPLLMT